MDKIQKNIAIKEKEFLETIETKTVQIDFLEKDLETKNDYIIDLEEKLKIMNKELENCNFEIEKYATMKIENFHEDYQTQQIEISFEEDLDEEDLKDSIPAFNASEQLKKTFSNNLDHNLDKSSERLNVVSKQEKILLDLNKHLNKESIMFVDEPDFSLLLGTNFDNSNGLIKERGSLGLGNSMKKFGNKLLNVIDKTNQMLKVNTNLLEQFA